MGEQTVLYDGIRFVTSSREVIAGWLKANGLDPSNVSMMDPVYIEDGELRYVHTEEVLEPRAVKVIHPWIEE